MYKKLNNVLDGLNYTRYSGVFYYNKKDTCWKWNTSRYYHSKILNNRAVFIDDHLNTNKSFGLSFVDPYGMAYGLMADYDDHNGEITEEQKKEAQKKLIQFLGVPYYGEEAIYTQGFHFFYNLSDPIHKTRIFQLQNFIKTEIGIDIELKVYNVRAPMSKKYKSCRRIKKKNTLSTEFIETILETANETEEKPEESHNPYAREIDGIGTKESIIEKMHNVNLGRDTRNEAMLELTRLNRYVNLPIQELVSIARSIDTGSKDFKIWDNARIEKEFIKMDKSCKLNPKHTSSIKSLKTNVFKSNIDLLSTWLIRICSSMEIRKIIADNFGAVRAIKRFKVGKYGAILLQEIFGKMIFNEQNERRIINNLKLSPTKIAHLLTGFQMSKKELLMIKEHYGMTQIDMKRLYKAVMNILFDQYKHNDQGWSWGYIKVCKQYILKNFTNKLNIMNNIIINIILFFKQHIYIEKKKLINILKVFYMDNGEKLLFEYVLRNTS